MKTITKRERVEALSARDRELYSAASAVSQRAYAPFSHTKIGAALRTAEGGVYVGCNVENASFGLTSCAERNAVFAAVAAEGPAMRIHAIAIFVSGKEASPCGACRQVLMEFGDRARVLFAQGRWVSRTTMHALLPLPFRLRK